MHTCGIQASFPRLLAAQQNTRLVLTDSCENCSGDAQQRTPVQHSTWALERRETRQKQKSFCGFNLACQRSGPSAYVSPPGIPSLGANHVVRAYHHALREAFDRARRENEEADSVWLLVRSVTLPLSDRLRQWTRWSSRVDASVLVVLVLVLRLYGRIGRVPLRPWRHSRTIEHPSLHVFAAWLLGTVSTHFTPRARLANAGLVTRG